MTLTSRRTFLKGVAASASAAPFILPSRVWSAPTGPNDVVTLGVIGLGAMGNGLLGRFIQFPEARVVAVCDVDTNHRDAAKKRVDKRYTNSDCAAYSDFREIINRKDIDAVVIAPPDHWHATMTLAALRAGKDVYCEKPLTHNIHEAVEVMKAVDANKRVLQTGSMQRSMKEFRIACELVRNGVIGRISRVECSFGGPPKPCDLSEEPTPKGLDWDLWCGPGPLRAYNAILFERRWRIYSEYGSGGVGDWGAHHLDIAQWGLGMDQSGPVEVVPPDNEKASEGCRLVYASGVHVVHKIGFGVRFVGEDGEVLVNRGKFQVILKGETIAGFESKEKSPGTSCEREVVLMERRFLEDAKIKLYNSKNHLTDFMECVRSRKKPNTNEQVGGRSAICCHLMNQGYFHHARFKWDPTKFKFTGGTGDPKWLTRDYRRPWLV